MSMYPQNLVCGACGGAMEGDASMAGAWVLCPHCGTRFQMPVVVSAPSIPTAAHAFVTPPPVLQQSVQEPEQEPIVSTAWRGPLTSHRISRINPLTKLAIILAFLVFGGWGGIIAGMLIVRFANPDAYATMLQRVPELKMIADRLP